MLPSQAKLDRDDFLTEAMGGCNHILCETTDSGATRLLSQCAKCHKPTSQIPYNEGTFSTWEGFGKLWEWSTKQEWWILFRVYGKQKELLWDSIISPDSFADMIYEYLHNNEVR